MRYLALIGAFSLLATLSTSAQVAIGVQTERSTFLLYERIDLTIAITNQSDTDILLDNNEGNPWLSFVITKHVDHNFVPVKEERDATFPPLTLKAGTTQTLRVNLTPLFSIRSIGDYTAAAVINLPGADATTSPNTLFSVLPGHQVWSQSRPLQGSERVYSLIRFSSDVNSTRLYLRVEDPNKNIIYTNIGLGDIAAFIDPDVFFDPEGNLHILHPFSSGHYLYTRTDPSGNIVHQGIFRTYRENPPRLHKLDDGNVIIVGGIEDNPNIPHDKLSDGQKPEATATKPEVPPANTTGSIP